MAMVERVKQFLDQKGVHYEVLPHREVFTSQEIAAASHVPGRHLAKVLVVRMGKEQYAMAVLPASCRLDMDSLKAVAGRKDLTLAWEEEFRPLFPDCEVGTMPPFGNLYGLPMYIDACFAKDAEFVFQAGNHHEVVRVPYKAFEQLVNPIPGEFCQHKREEIR